MDYDLKSQIYEFILQCFTSFGENLFWVTQVFLFHDKAIADPIPLSIYGPNQAMVIDRKNIRISRDL